MILCSRSGAGSGSTDQRLGRRAYRTAVRYPPWFGQRKLDRDGIPAAYPFGYGLGYVEAGA